MQIDVVNSSNDLNAFKTGKGPNTATEVVPIPEQRKQRIYFVGDHGAHRRPGPAAIGPCPRPDAGHSGPLPPP